MKFTLKKKIGKNALWDRFEGTFIKQTFCVQMDPIKHCDMLLSIAQNKLGVTIFWNKILFQLPIPKKRPKLEQYI